MVRSIDWTIGALRAPRKSSPCVIFACPPGIEAPAHVAVFPDGTAIHQRRAISHLNERAIEHEAIEADDGNARRTTALSMRGPAHDRAARADRSLHAGRVRRDYAHVEGR